MDLWKDIEVQSDRLLFGAHRVGLLFDDKS